MITISHNNSISDEIIKDIARQFNISVNSATKIIEDYFKAIESDLINKGKTSIPHIGSFKKKHKQSRTIYNVGKGEYETSPSHYGVKFTPKKSLIKLMNERNDSIQ